MYLLSISYPITLDCKIANTFYWRDIGGRLYAQTSALIVYYRILGCSPGTKRPALLPNVNCSLQQSRTSVKEAEQATSFLGHVTQSWKWPSVSEYLQFNAAILKKVGSCHAAQEQSILHTFPNPSSRDLQRVNEDKGVRPGGWEADARPLRTHCGQIGEMEGFIASM